PWGPSSDQPWKPALSWITTLYVPALSDFTALLLNFRLIVYPGPSVPMRVGVVDRLADAPSTRTAETTIAVNKRITMFRINTLLRMRARRGGLRASSRTGFGEAAVLRIRSCPRCRFPCGGG